MSKRLSALLIPAVVLGMTVTAQAQWPLGREAPPLAAKSEDHATQVTATGRFQIFVSPQAKGYTFMLDTDTGKIWILKKDHASGDYSMQRIPVDQVDAEQAEKAGTKKAKPDDAAASKAK
jgi:hypothetical protein